MGRAQINDVGEICLGHAELFESLHPTKWLDGETLFSLCSRHHRLSGNRLAANTCRQLFGHATRGAAHDFPSRVDAFAEQAQGQLGTPATIIREHTILPYYLPFRPPDQAQRAVEAMRGDAIGSLKFQLGLLTSRFRANHPLKACFQCMRADRERWSTPYWHVQHQLPGVWVCPVHGEPLWMSSFKATGVGRFQWFLPDATQLVAQGAESLRADGPLSDLARAAIALWSMPAGSRIAPEHACRAYRHALRVRGLIRGAGQGRLRLKDIGTEYAAHVAPLRQIDELNALPSSPDAAAREVARMGYEPRGGTHPLRQLTMIGWLFGDFASFTSCCRDLAERPSNECRGPDQLLATAQQQPHPLRDRLLELVESGTSVSAAARQLGIDPATGMAWAASAGVSTPKRPSVIKGDLRLRMVAALEKGADKGGVARLGGVSIESVTRLLRTEVEVRERWLCARRQHAMLEARRTWLRVMNANPLSGIKAVRLLEPAAYAWLYRNDKAWLDAQAKRMRLPKRTIATRVDWSARDQALADAVRREALALASIHPGTRIKLWQIYQRLPELKAKLAYLDRLPLTRRAIDEAISAATARKARQGLAVWQR